MNPRKKAILAAALYMKKNQPDNYNVEFKNGEYLILQRKRKLTTLRNGLISGFPYWDIIQRIDLSLTPTLEEIEDEFNLKLVINERPFSYITLPKFHCSFNFAWVKDGIMLRGIHGNGMTPEAAKKDYLERIKGKTLVILAPGKNKEINIPA